MKKIIALILISSTLYGVDDWFLPEKTPAKQEPVYEWPFKNPRKAAVVAAKKIAQKR